MVVPDRARTLHPDKCAGILLQVRHSWRVTIHPMSQSAAYAPSPEFVRNANVQGMEGYRALYERAKEDPQAFWGELAEKEIEWFQKWDRVLDWSNAPFGKWFSGATTNVSYNCIDRHL